MREKKLYDSLEYGYKERKNIEYSRKPIIVSAIILYNSLYGLVK